MLGQLSALPWGRCRWGLTGKGRSPSTFIIFSQCFDELEIFERLLDIQVHVCLEGTQFYSVLRTRAADFQFAKGILSQWNIFLLQVKHVALIKSLASLSFLCLFLFLLWLLEEMGAQEWKDKRDSIHPGMICSYACWVAAREATRFPPRAGGTWDLATSKAPYIGPGEGNLSGLLDEEEISGTLRKAVRNLTLHDAPALLTWENRANLTMHIPCCTQVLLWSSRLLSPLAHPLSLPGTLKGKTSSLHAVAAASLSYMHTHCISNGATQKQLFCVGETEVS